LGSQRGFSQNPPDWDDKDAYKRYAKGDLTPPASGVYKVLRGGSWYLGTPTAFRCVDRSSYPDSRSDGDIGFRSARDAD